MVVARSRRLPLSGNRLGQVSYPSDFVSTEIRSPESNPQIVDFTREDGRISIRAAL
jgi:hypothetical protein